LIKKELHKRWFISFFDK